MLPQFDDTITLPDTTSHAGKGEDNPAREEGFLTDTKLFEGDAWFTRKADLSAAVGKTTKLVFERTRITKLYIDGEYVGTQNSLVSPHVYDITKYVKGGEQEITVCVSNVGYPTKGGHLTSPDTQTNWNGITGEMAVKIYGAAYADEVKVYPLLEEKAFRVVAKIKGAESGKAVISAESFNAPEGRAAHRPAAVNAIFTGSELIATLPLGEDARTWDEYSPELYNIKIDIGGDVYEIIAGLREFKAVKDKFYINGRKTFLRGKHDGMIFPLTGYAPTTVDEWLRVLKISRSYGMNHYRFHTCCPPEAAFIAADMLGIYMEPQLPFWGTIQAPGEEGFNEEEQNFLIAEGFRMLDAFGSHPSHRDDVDGQRALGQQGAAERDYRRVQIARQPPSLHAGFYNFQWFPNVIENDDFFVGVRLANDRLIRGSYAMCDAPLCHIQTDKPATTHNYDSIVHPTRAASATEVSEDGTVQIQYGTTMKTVKAGKADADFVPMCR